MKEKMVQLNRIFASLVGGVEIQGSFVGFRSSTQLTKTVSGHHLVIFAKAEIQ